VAVVVEDLVAGADVDAEGNNMKNNINCPLCHKEIYSEMGKSCKMCGMVLEDKSKDFCSKVCRIRYIRMRGNN